MIPLILAVLHLTFSVVGFGLFGYLYLGPSWASLTNTFRAQYVGVIISTWGLFQGATGMQVARQGFGEGKGHSSEGILFFVLWAAEVAWMLLVIAVGVGGNFTFYSSLFTTGSSIPIAMCVFFGLTAAVAAVQFLYWLIKCGAGARERESTHY